MILDMERIRMLMANWSATFILFNYQSQP